MTQPPADPAGLPPYLVRVLLCAPRDPDRPGRGSGVLLLPDLVLTARHLVETDTFHHLYPCADLRVEIAGAGHGVAVLTAPEQATDLALLHLIEPVVGAVPAALVTRLAPADLAGAAGRLAAAGYPGGRVGADPNLYRELLTWFPPGQDPQGGLTDLQLQGGLPGGLSGGALYLDHTPERPLIGLLRLGSEGAATSRVIPAGVILEFLHRVAPGLVGQVRTLTAAEAFARRCAPSCVADPDVWDRERQTLRDLLVKLRAWKLVRDRTAFVEFALGDHPAAADLIWDDPPYTVAASLVQRLKQFKDIPLRDGRQAVCALLAEVAARPEAADLAIGEPLRRLTAAFGCVLS